MNKLLLKSPIVITQVVAVFAILLGVSNLLNTKVNKTLGVKGIREISVAKPNPNPVQFLIVSPAPTTSSQESYSSQHSDQEPDLSSLVNPPLEETPIAAPAPAASPPVTSQDAKEITVTLNGQVYDDLNCNNAKEEGETGIANQQILILQPNAIGTDALMETLTSDSNGGYSFTKTIKENESLTLQPLAIDHVYIPPEVSLNLNNQSTNIDLSSCSQE